jgi:hypothetical protein
VASTTIDNCPVHLQLQIGTPPERHRLARCANALSDALPLAVCLLYDRIILKAGLVLVAGQTQNHAVIECRRTTQSIRDDVIVMELSDSELLVALFAVTIGSLSSLALYAFGKFLAGH